MENINQLLILLLLPIVVFPWAAFGLSRFAGVDIVKLHQPMRWFDIQSVHSGHWPMWNPHIFSGSRQFAEGESGFLYLGNLPQYLPIDFSYAYTIIMLLHFVLAGILAYACIRHYGIDKRLSCGFSIVWTYSPFFIFHLSAPTILIVLLWYPAFLMLADSFRDNPLRRLGLLAILSSQMLLAGSVQMAAFGFFAYFIYAIVRWIFERLNTLATLARFVLIPLISMGIGITIAAIQLFPTMELISFSQRVGKLSEAFRSTGSWLDFTRLGSIVVFPLMGDIYQLLHYGSSLLYSGFIPGILIICALCYGWRDNRTRAHLITGLILVLLAMGTRNPFNNWMSAVPPFDKLRYLGRFAGFASWHLLVASCLWFAAWLEKYAPGKLNWAAMLRPFILPLIAAFVLVGLYLLTNGASSFAYSGLIFAAVQLAVLLFMLRRPSLAVHMVTIAAIFSLALAYPLANLLQLNTSEYKRVIDNFKRIASEYPGGRLFIEGEGPLVSFDGHGRLFLAPYRTMKGFAGGSAGSMGGLNILSGYSPMKFESWRLIIERGKTVEPAIPASSREDIYRLIAADLVVTRDDVSIEGYVPLGEADLTGVAEGGLMQAAPAPSPGYFLANEIIAYENVPEYEILALALSPYRDGVAHVSGNLRPGPRSTAAKIEPFKVSGNSFSVRGDFSGDNFLVVLDSWYPGWHAYLDTQEIPVYSVNGLFKGVEVPAGGHTIEFRFIPKAFYFGLRLSIIGLLVSILLIALPAHRTSSGGCRTL